MKKALKAEGEKNKMKKQTKLDIQKALNEDPTIYQYDEVYDDMERTKSQSDVNKQREKKPRYIQNLLKTADRRKKEQEHRIGRMVQKEREAEGDMYADKESFVTSAYRAKLEEFQKMEEEEARMSRLEAIADVTKQPDMSGFYRHLYAQTVEYKGEGNGDGSNETVERSVKQEEKQNLSGNVGEREERDTAAGETSKSVKSKKSRQYRKRAVEAYESESETETNKEESRTDKIAVSSVNEGADVVRAQESERKVAELDKSDVNINENNRDTTDKDVDTKNAGVSRNTNESASKDGEIESKETPVETEDRSSILEKRTKGPVFEAALQRYYARKAKRIAVV